MATAAERLNRLPQENLRWTLLPPLGLWLAALVSLFVAAELGSVSPFHGSAWAHWDSSHYLSIATHGYDVHHCRPGEVPKPATWCGNAAWFPAYPWLIAVVHAVGVPAVDAGVALAWTFAGVTLLLVWRLQPSWTALVYAAFAPGYVYQFAVYPMSLFVAATVAFLLCVRRRSWPGAVAAGFVAGLTYPIGVLVLPVVALVYVGYATRRVYPTAVTALPPLIAFGVVVLVQRVQTARWTAFFDVQHKYGHGLHDPFRTTGQLIGDIGRSSGWGAAPYWQTLLVTVVVVLAVVVAVRGRDLLLLVFAVAAWALPLTQANVSVWRSHDALLPVAPLVGRLPRPVAVLLIAASIVVGVAVARLYFENALV